MIPTKVRKTISLKTQESENKCIFITGASSGIGKAIALYLADKGFRVYGTTRNPVPERTTQNDTQKTNSGLFKFLTMDVKNQESIRAAVSSILKAEGKIDVLINNAGMGIAGPIEESLGSDIATQFDTNFTGTVRMIQSVLPEMRKAKRGLIVNIGSVAGIIPIPYQSFYSCSKAAIEALTETLIQEIKPFGIKAVIIEPGDIKTGFTQARVKNINPDSVYKNAFRKSIDVMENDERNGGDPLTIAKAVYKVITSKNPPVRQTVGLKYKIFVLLKRLLPSRFTIWIVSKIYT